jgi:predicted transposase YbfD/YdcC
MALANVRAPGNNEAAGALQLVELLQLKGCVVTADALHCHRGMAKAIVERGGDYVLAVKNNQPGLLRDAKAAISAAEHKKATQATTKNADHGRKEARTALVATVSDMAKKHDFPGLKAVARITSKRGSDKTVQRYFLLTQCYKPAELLRIVRQHWGIENVLHWTLDVVLDEDQTAEPKRSRSRQPRRPAATFPQYRSRSSRYKDIPAGQAQTCRLGRQLPRRYAPQHAIALPSRGG